MDPEQQIPEGLSGFILGHGLVGVLLVEEVPGTDGLQKSHFFWKQREALCPYFPSSHFPVFTQIHQVLFIVTWNICWIFFLY